MNSGEALIQAQGLQKHYGTVHALRGVDIHVHPGEVVGFLGPNGAGKTTTMKILTGSIAPSSGVAKIAGYDLLHEPLQCRRQIGYLPQDPPLYPEMTVAAYLDHVARLKGISRSHRRREVVEAMERCSILEVERRHLHKLSGGNRQRVGLAQALLGSPPVLILDEATAGLDPTQVARFRDLVRDLASDHGILLSTHILSEVEYCCRRVVMINRGAVILESSVADLRQRAAAQSRLRLSLRDGSVQALAQALRECAWAQEITLEDDSLLCRVEDNQRSQLIALAEAHGGLRELHEERRSLEEVFADVVAASESQVVGGG